MEDQPGVLTVTRDQFKTLIQSTIDKINDQLPPGEIRALKQVGESSSGARVGSFGCYVEEDPGMFGCPATQARIGARQGSSFGHAFDKEVIEFIRGTGGGLPHRLVVNDV